MDDEALPMAKVARRFNVGTKTIKRWIEELGFPKPYYIGKMPYFSAIKVQMWQDEQKKNEEPPPKPEEYFSGKGRTSTDK